MPPVLIVATVVLLLVHVPPLTVELTVVVPPVHTALLPVTVPALGNGLTVIDCVAVLVPQLLVTLYDMVAVPMAPPVTIPDVFTVAIVMLLLLQVPPVTVGVNAVAEPEHTVDAPEMVPADGAPKTVTVTLAALLPHTPVTE